MKCDLQLLSENNKQQLAFTERLLCTRCHSKLSFTWVASFCSHNRVFIVPVLETRKLRLREVKCTPLGYKIQAQINLFHNLFLRERERDSAHMREQWEGQRKRERENLK